MDAKKILGLEVRRLRETLKLSQEALAERAQITYQYLSALENGRENFSIGVLEGLSKALNVSVPVLVATAYQGGGKKMDWPKIDRRWLRDVPLPPRLTLKHLGDAMNETQRVIRLLNESLVTAGGRALPSYIQANNFSGIVSNILSDSFDRLTPYKHNHDQRYPDLICKDGAGKNVGGLEIKSTIQVGKGGESHNGHSGWHLVACFRLDDATGDIRFIHAMFADLIGHTHSASDWKYVGSSVNKESGSQRTETYNTTGVGTTKLRDGSAYLDLSEIDPSRWRPQHAGPVPAYSIFHPDSKR